MWLKGKTEGNNYLALKSNKAASAIIVMLLMMLGIQSIHKHPAFGSNNEN